MVNRRQTEVRIERAPTAEPAAGAEPDAATWIWSDLHLGHRGAQPAPCRTAGRHESGAATVSPVVLIALSPLGASARGSPGRRHRPLDWLTANSQTPSGCISVSSRLDQSSCGIQERLPAPRRVMRPRNRSFTPFTCVDTAVAVASGKSTDVRGRSGARPSSPAPSAIDAVRHLLVLLLMLAWLRGPVFPHECCRYPKAVRPKSG